MSDFSVQWFFSKRTGESVSQIPSTELLTSADLGWKPDVKKDVPTIFTTTIKFTTEGEWEISAVGNTEENKNKNQAGAGDTIHITITSTRSYFGWAKLPAKPGSGTTITTPTQTHSP